MADENVQFEESQDKNCVKIFKRSCFNYLQKCLLHLYRCTPPTSVAGENIQFEESQDKNCVKDFKKMK